MKQLITALLALMAYTSATAQKDIPAFGKVEKSDLEMTACDFDNAAEAEVLFDVGEVFCQLNLTSLTGSYLTTELERRVRIKILNEKGLGQGQYQDSLPFRTKYRRYQKPFGPNL